MRQMLVRSAVRTCRRLLSVIGAVRRSSVGQILIKLSLARGVSSEQRCQLSNNNLECSGRVPEQIVGSSSICKYSSPSLPRPLDAAVLAVMMLATSSTSVVRQ